MCEATARPLDSLVVTQSQRDVILLPSEIGGPLLQPLNKNIFHYII